MTTQIKLENIETAKLSITLPVQSYTTSTLTTQIDIEIERSEFQDTTLSLVFESETSIEVIDDFIEKLENLKSNHLIKQ